MTEEVIKKLEEVFAIGGTDGEACFYADISHQTLYDYQKLHPEFVERKNALKERPVLKARQTIVKNLEQPETAKWYLEKKKKDEFSSRNEVTGPEGKPLEIREIKQLDDKALYSLIQGADIPKGGITGIGKEGVGEEASS